MTRGRGGGGGAGILGLLFVSCWWCPGLTGVLIGLACVVGCFCSGPVLVVLGFVYLFQTNSRQSLINQFNNDVDDWTNTYLKEMKSIYTQSQRDNKTSPIMNDYGYLTPSNSSDVNLENIRSSHDDPQIESWEEFYFTVNHTFTNIEYEITPSTEYVHFNASLSTEKTTILDEKYYYFHMSGERFAYSDYQISSQKTRCEDDGGYFKSKTGRHENCFFFYVVDRVCVLIDPTDLVFGYMETDATDHGCNYQEQFKGGDDEAYYSPSFYKSIKKGDEGELLEFTVKFEVRSIHDPEVRLSYYTKGTNDFGSTAYSNHSLGLTLLVVGVLLICLIFVFPIGSICCCAYIRSRQKKRVRELTSSSSSYSRITETVPFFDVEKKKKEDGNEQKLITETDLLTALFADETTPVPTEKRSEGQVNKTQIDGYNSNVLPAPEEQTKVVQEYPFNVPPPPINQIQIPDQQQQPIITEYNPPPPTNNNNNFGEYSVQPEFNPEYVGNNNYNQAMVMNQNQTSQYTEYTGY